MQTFGLPGLRLTTASFERSTEAINQALERLATGSRINRAADDPSGMMAVESLDAEIASLEAAMTGRERSMARLGAQEGSMSVLSDLLIELEGVIVTAAGGAGRSPEELEALQLQANSIIDAIDLLGTTARFNGELLLGGYGSTSLGEVMVSVPSDDPDGEPTMQAVTLSSLRSGGALNLIDGDLEAAMQSAESARSAVAFRRGSIGATQQQMQIDMEEMSSRLINLAGARSNIQDADIAQETSALVRAQVLQQASIQAALIGRQSAEGTLALLTGLTGQPAGRIGL